MSKEQNEIIEQSGRAGRDVAQKLILKTREELARLKNAEGMKMKTEYTIYKPGEILPSRHDTLCDDCDGRFTEGAPKAKEQATIAPGNDPGVGGTVKVVPRVPG